MPNQVTESMSFDIITDPVVKSPRTASLRRGRGFSKDEVAQVELSIDEARQMGLIVDLRRKTMHQENIDALKQYIKDLETLVVKLEKEDKVKAAPDTRIAELSSLRSVKKAEAELLVKAGIKSIEDLAYCEIDKVSKNTGINQDRLTIMVKAALKKV